MYSPSPTPPSARRTCAPAEGASATMRGMATARKRAGSRLSVAVLYSGRFYGELTLPAWSKDHLDNLIVPNGAAVFVVVDPVNLCDKSSAVQRAISLPNASKWETASLALLQEATAVFGGWPNLYAKVVNVAAGDVAKKFSQVGATAVSGSQYPFICWHLDALRLVPMRLSAAASLST